MDSTFNFFKQPDATLLKSANEYEKISSKLSVIFKRAERVNECKKLLSSPEKGMRKVVCYLSLTALLAIAASVMYFVVEFEPLVQMATYIKDNFVQDSLFIAPVLVAFFLTVPTILFTAGISLVVVGEYHKRIQSKASINSVVESITPDEAEFLYRHVVSKQDATSVGYCMSTNAHLSRFLAMKAQGQPATLREDIAEMFFTVTVRKFKNSYKAKAQELREEVMLSNVDSLVESVFGKSKEVLGNA